MALLLQPKLIIMDEPTTALDMVIQRQILETLKSLRQQHAFSVLFISHDLGLVLELADRVLVMYAGEIVESQASAALLDAPLHPYTRALLRALPDPETRTAAFAGIPGAPPDLRAVANGCAFAPRCALVQAACWTTAPALAQFGSAAVRCPVVAMEQAHG
jgi:oligopeptide/dipeptide ABC transporter ATP-binding protein